MLNLPRQQILIQLKDINNMTQYSFYKSSIRDQPYYTGKCWNTNKQVKIKSIPMQYKLRFPNEFNIEIQKIQQIQNMENSQPFFLDCFGIQSQNQYIYLVMENWQSDLTEIKALKQQINHHSQQTDSKYFTDNDCIHITKIIYQALKTMMQNKIQFKGLTSYDVLFTQKYIKIAIDISLQYFLNSKSNLTEEITRGSLTQRIPYMSPQTKINNNNNNSELFSQKCNVWAFGCILLQLMINELPWSQKNQKINSLNKFKERVLPKHFPADNNYQLKLKPEDLIKFNARPQKLQQLVKRCLIYNDKERLQLNQLEPLINELNNI